MKYKTTTKYSTGISPPEITCWWNDKQQTCRYHQSHGSLLSCTPVVRKEGRKDVTYGSKFETFITADLHLSSFEQEILYFICCLSLQKSFKILKESAALQKPTSTHQTNSSEVYLFWALDKRKPTWAYWWNFNQIPTPAFYSRFACFVKRETIKQAMCDAIRCGQLYNNVMVFLNLSLYCLDVPTYHYSGCEAYVNTNEYSYSDSSTFKLENLISHFEEMKNFFLFFL